MLSRHGDAIGGLCVVENRNRNATACDDIRSICRFIRIGNARHEHIRMPFAPKTQGRFNPLEALVERMVSRSESDIDAGGRFGIAKLLGAVKGREAR